jgi:hypothetical protein
MLLHVAKQLEFNLTLMCTTKEGYQTRARATTDAARLLSRKDVWDTKSDADGLEDAQEIVGILKHACTHREIS